MPFFPFGKFGNSFKTPNVVKASNIRGGIITGQTIILAGGTTSVLRSQNYDGTATGLALFGDGSASFFGTVTLGASTVIEADLYSSNWDGAVPATLPDGTATLGYYLDYSAGAAQFENIYANGGTIKDLDISGNLTMTASGIIRTAVSGQRVEMTSASNGRFSLFSGAALETREAYMAAYDSAGEPSVSLYGPTSSSGSNACELWFSSGGAFAAYLGNNSGGILDLDFAQVGLVDGGPALPSLMWLSDLNTGFYRIGANNIGLSLDGALTYNFNQTALYIGPENNSLNTSIKLGPTNGAVGGAITIMDFLTGASPIGARIRVDGGDAATNYLGSLRVQSLQFKVSMHGDQALPDYGFDGDTDTGAYRVGPNAYGITTGGTKRFALTPYPYFYTLSAISSSNVVARFDSSGQLAKTTSSRKSKTDIRQMSSALSCLIYQLEPVMYRWKDTSLGTQFEAGLIAEEVVKVMPWVVAKNKDGDPDGVAYDMLVVPLIAELSKLNNRVRRLENKQ